jgi:GPI mannosyltransferase 3
MFTSRTLTCGIIFILDSLYYHKLTFTPLNFLLTNLSSVSLFYGSSPWHYYLSQALPILCTSTLPFTLHGIWTAYEMASMPQRIALGCVVWTIGVYSLAGHKEWRFLHPVLPLLHIFASKSLVDLYHSSRQKKYHRATAGEKSASKTLFPSYLLPIRTSHLLLILTTLPFSLYVVLFYGDAPISVMTYLRALPEAELQGGSIGFLMPCHSTPWLAYLHRRELGDQGRMWALGCEPPLQ